jgi:secretion/DNA translocation related CpaE-like protein
VVGQHVALVSRNAQLVDEIRQLCAMAGQPLQVTAHPDEVARLCRRASLVVLDGEALDVAGQALRAQPADVVVVTDDAANLAVWEAAVRVGASRVLAHPADNALLLELVALAAEPPGPAGALLAVIGGRGGAGASTLAVALAWAVAEQPRTVTVVDLDPFGGGLDVALGVERVDGLRWPQLNRMRGAVPSAALREQLPAVGGLAVLSMAASVAPDGDAVALPDRPAVTSVLDATRRGQGVVVADLPRWSTDAANAVIADCTTALLVVPADVRAVASATTCAHRLRSLCDDVRVVVRIDGRSRLRANDVTSALGLDLLATVRHEAGLTAAADRGDLVRWLHRSRLGRTAKRSVGQLLSGGDGTLR